MTDGQTDGRTDGRTDGQTTELKTICLPISWGRHNNGLDSFHYYIQPKNLNNLIHCSMQEMLTNKVWLAMKSQEIIKNLLALY